MNTVAYASPFVPAEWIAAHGFAPSRVSPSGATGVGAPAGACPFADAFLEGTAGGYRAVVFTTTCDQMRRASEDSAAETFLLNVPHTWTRPAHRLYLDELQRMGRFLVRLGGSEPTPAKLLAEMRRYDDARELLRHAQGLLSGRAWAAAVAELHASGDPGYEPPAGPGPTGGAPLALLGVPVWGPHLRLYELVEAAGGEIVLDGTETGERGLPAPFDRRGLRDDPLLELGDAYFGTIPDAFRRPNSGLYDWLAAELPGRGVEGILFLRCTWCDLWHAELERLKEWTGVPVVAIDLTGEHGSLSRAETRVQALLDMLR